MELTTYKRIEQVLVDMGCPDSEVTPNARLVDLVDSLERAQLVLELEDAFKLEICDDDLQKFCTVADIVKYANSRLAAV